MSTLCRGAAGTVPCGTGRQYLRYRVCRPADDVEGHLPHQERDTHYRLPRAVQQGRRDSARRALVRLRGAKGTEFTSDEFRRYCLDIGVKLEFASTNTSQQIGANERADQTLAGIVRCFLADSGFPIFLWGKLMLIAVYLSNRVPRAALRNCTPRKETYGNDAYLVNVRVIGARSLVQVGTHTKKWEPRTWEGRLVGYSTDSK